MSTALYKLADSLHFFLNLPKELIVILILRIVLWKVRIKIRVPEVHIFFSTLYRLADFLHFFLSRPKELIIILILRIVLSKVRIKICVP